LLLAINNGFNPSVLKVPIASSLDGRKR